MSNVQVEGAQAPSNSKTVDLFVNGRQQTVAKGKITYEDVVALAYPNPDFQNNTYKVTYFRKNDNHEGTLAKGGQPIEVIEGMSFTVVPSIRS